MAERNASGLTRLTVTTRGGSGRGPCQTRRVESHRSAVARAEPPRHYDPPHILWYFGAITAAGTASATVFSVGAGARGTYQLLVGLLFAGSFGAGAALLLRRGWRVPGGVLVVASVAMVPAVGQAFERLVGVWPDVADDGLSLLEDFEGGLFVLALATIVAGLAAFARVGFPFVFATVTIAVVFAAQFLVPAFVNEPSLDDRAGAFIVTGAVLLLVGLVLDSVARGDEAFWWHVIGLLALAVGLTWYAFFRDAGWAWVTMLVLGAVLILASAPIDRATWTTYGVLGLFAATLNYDSDWLGSWRSPALMVAVSVGLILLGMALSLYARAWAARLRRRPADPAPPDAP
jgi:hypothetical protein